MHYLEITSDDLSGNPIIINNIDLLQNYPEVSDQLSLVGSELILSNEIHVSDIKFKLNKLDLSETSISSLNGEQEGVEHLVKMISESYLKDSLHKIDRWKCNISKQTFDAVLHQNECEHIWVEEDA